jgi:magnesium transporter
LGEAATLTPSGHTDCPCVSGGAIAPKLTILCSSIVATLIASLLPWMLDRLDIDPAMASGPVATVLQDLISVAIYLGIATAII